MGRPQRESNGTTKIFSDRIKKLVDLRKEEAGVSQNRIARDIGVAQSVISSWVNDTATPTIDKLKDAAAYFGVSADYLLGLSDTMVPKTEKRERIATAPVEPRNDNEGREAGRGGPDYEDMYAHAAAERDALAEKLAKMRINDVEEIENYKKEIAWHKRANEVLEAQLEIVRLIFGGEAHG